MNSTAKTLVAVFAVLLAVAGALIFFGTGDGGKVLQIRGLQSSLLAGAAGPVHVTRISVSNGGRTVEVRRTGNDDWRLTEPCDAVADTARVGAILQAFSGDVVSHMAVDTGGDDRSFGLSPDRAFSVLIHGERDGVETAVVALEIGDVQPVDGRQPDTFVRIPGESVVFRVQSLDLRATFADGLDGLRSKRLFAFGAEDVVGLSYTNAGAPNPVDRSIRLVVDGFDDATERRPVTSAQPRALKSRVWKLVEPDGKNAGNIDAIAIELAGTTVERYAPSLPDGVSIPEGTPGLTVSLADKTRIDVRMSDVVDGFRWVKVTGVPDFARVESKGGRPFVAGVLDVRDRRMLNVAREDIAGVTRSDAADSGDGSFSIVRRGNEFVLAGGRGADLERAEVEKYLRQLGEMMAVDVVAPGPESAAELDRPAIALQLLVSDRAPVRIAFSAVGKDGRRYARVEGTGDVFIVDDRAIDALHVTALQLRRHSLVGVDPSRIASVTVTDSSGRKAVFMPPQNSSKSAENQAAAFWKVIRGDGRIEASAAVTEAVGGALSISAAPLADGPRPSSVKPDMALVEFAGRDFRTILTVSSDARQGGYVAAAPGEKAFSGRSFLVSAAIVDSLLGFTKPAE